MVKGDKVRLVKACSRFDKMVGLEVGAVGECVTDIDDDVICVLFDKRPLWVMVDRLEVIQDSAILISRDEAKKFISLLDRFYDELAEESATDVGLFVALCKEKLNEVTI